MRERIKRDLERRSQEEFDFIAAEICGERRNRQGVYGCCNGDVCLFCRHELTPFPSNASSGPMTS